MTILGAGVCGVGRVVGSLGWVGGGTRVGLLGGPAALDNSLLEAFILDCEVGVWKMLGAESSAFAEE